MKSILLWCALAFAGLAARAQDPAPLSKGEVNTLFPETVKARLGIKFPVFKAFAFQDRHGSNYVLLTESQDSIVHDGPNADTLHRAIKAVCVVANGDGYTKNWEINDFIDKTAGEISIWFWSKSCAFTDLDGDGLADVFIAYSTKGEEDGNGGRLKLILVYKGQKIAIRHQDSDLDEGRQTRVDATFYALPATVQQQGIAILKRIVQNEEAYLGSGWEEGMKKHKSVL
ncbi:hypothetical protein DCC81_19005 [Chitinophaga parva]|uniref:VCBS repeat-containing protein n=1 Tax=Chitinophaga parva TaxID=2169414 RepID=A0A2T7BJ84_9BACT|nr:hypothetical protein [Chitinophaga parva]PUZ26312.1 hypothetical protein DCC81_19005 [Chitinophaga parva]